MTPVEQITSLYIGYFGRAPDPEGLNYWVGRLNDGFSLAEIAESFSVQAESQAKYPYLSNPNIASPQAFITQVYLNLFNRTPDAEGLAYWTAQLNNGTDIGDFILDVISGAVTNPDRAIIENKVEVGVDFALKASNEPGFVYDTDAANAAVEVINGVDETQASVDAAKAEADAFFEQGPAPTISVLTTAIDNIAGTAGADQINGVIAGGANGTFNTGDTINGGAGEDTLSLIVTSGATITPASISNVETISVQDLNNGNINLANATGVETLASNNSTGFTSFTNVANLVDAEVSNTTVGAGLGISYNASVVTGIADAQNVAFNNATGGAFVGVNGVEQFNVTATGNNVAGIGSSSDITTVNTAGSGNITYTGAFATSVTTFNASASTGNVSAEFVAGGDVAATGGAGADVFDFGAGLTTADVVNGGAGFDTVVVNGANYSAAAAAAPFNGLTSIERVTFDGAVGAVLNGATFTNAGITNLQFDTAGNDTINNAGSARTYEFGTANTGSALFNLSAGVTTLNLALLGSAGSAAPNDGASADVFDLTVNQAAGATNALTININSTGDLFESGAPETLNADYNEVGTIDIAAGSTINITGEGNLFLDGLVNRGSVNASAATGNLVLQGSEAVGAAVGDADAGVTGVDTFTLGAGRDVVQFNSGLDSGVANTTSGATAGALYFDVINGFTAGAIGDVLDFTGVAGDAGYTALSGDAQAAINALFGINATLEDAADLAVAATTQAGAGAGQWTAFTFQGQTYAVYDAADVVGDTFDAANDVLVQLTGVTISSLTDANFA